MAERGAPPDHRFRHAFDQYAADAFRLHALDYLTKPVDPEGLAESLDRARDSLKPQDRGALEARFQAMLEARSDGRTSGPTSS